MRVLIVHPSMSFYGGAEIVIVRLANYLSKQGIKNTLLTCSVSTEIQNDLKATEIIIPENQPKRGLIALFFHIQEALTLRKYILKNINDFDIVNIHNFPSELSSIAVPKPVIWMCNEPPEICLGSKSKYRFVSFGLKMMNRVFLVFDRLVVRRYIKKMVVADEFNSERFERIYGINPTIINYGIDYRFFSKMSGDDVNDPLGLRNKFVLVQVGALTPLKNQIESIKIVEALIDKIPEIKLVLVGSGDKENEKLLKEYVHEKGIDSYVLFMGQLSQEETRDIYHISNVAIFPVKSQGGWLSPFEALSTGTPIVVSALMTASSIITSKDLGVVTDDFKGVIMGIYTDQERHMDKAKKSGRWISKNLTWNKFGKKMVELFEEII